MKKARGKNKETSAAPARGWGRLFQQKAAGLVFIFVLTFLSFSNIFGNQFVLDDFDFITHWPLIRDLRNVPRFFVGYIPPDGQPGVYSPLKTLWHAVNYQLWGEAVFGYHLVSLLIHAAGIWLVYQIVYELSRRRDVSFWTALLFAVHPVHVEAITFMTASVDTLGIVFLFAGFYFHLRANRREGRVPVFREDGNTGEENRPVGGWGNPRGGAQDRVWAVLFAVLAVFTHELAISMPLLIVFYEKFFTRPRRTWREVVPLAWPFFAIVAVYILCKWGVLGMINRGGYVAGSFSLTMAVIVKAWAQYLAALVFPLSLSHNPVIAPGIFAFDPSDFNRAAVLAQSWTDGYTLKALAVLGLLVVWVFISRRRRPLVGFCAGWLFISLLPGANIVPSSVYFAERYLYPGSLGFCLLLATGIVASQEAALACDRTWMKRAVTACAALIVVFYGGRTWLRNMDWKDNRRLYEGTVRMNPESAVMQSNLGIVYAQEGEWDLALNAFQAAIALKPDDAHFYFAVAPVYLEKGLPDQAIAAYRRAIALNPAFAEAYFNLAGVYAQVGKEDEVRSNLNRSIWLFQQQGRVLEAGMLLQQVESVLQSPPDPDRDALTPRVF
ncbi:MAG TPA: tetratricopeptide repeat protein [Candidatus Omnitrophota bacterium]|mgnify:CR=1 FL=1|nr:tetratricopeptide repeat protein [Candidatus Omnitrophota bacterium]HQO57800.1 tetratricopeptide repeat protein [Candidatus Omnitrophota bacterium]HQP11508.1 tetratricopeptide repeat protein [Candidatus Omnitrophota bacterium]